MATVIQEKLHGMQISKTQASPTEVKLVISASSPELESVKKHVLGHFARSVKVPGFRPGKAPADLIEKNVDQRAFLDEFLEHAMNGLYRKAMESEGLRPTAQPKVQVKKFVPFTDLEFEVETEVIGKVSLPSYKTTKVPKPKIMVGAKDVNEVLKNLQTRMADREEVQRAAKDGDEVTIDFSSRDEKGRPVTGAEGKDHPIILGSKQFIPGFEENLIGLTANQKKQFVITFPKDYTVKALQGKLVTFEVEAKKVSKLEKPKLDDGLAAKAGPFKTLVELKADVKKQLKLEREQNAKQAYENEIISRIANNSTVDIPKSMIDEQVMSMEEEEKRNLAYRGQTWQEHLAEEGITEEQHRERHRPQAEARVKAGLVLSEIAEKEGIKVTPEELEIRLQLLKGQYKDPTMQAELDKPEAKNDIASRLLTEKTIEKLVGYAAK